MDILYMYIYIYNKKIGFKFTRIMIKSKIVNRS